MSEQLTRAQALHNEAIALSDAGDEDAALSKYMAALALDMNRPDTLYNVGLRHKYKGNWRESFRYNKRSVEIRPEDEAANWNLAIAATALRDWSTVRAVWRRLGIAIEEGDGPIESNFGMAVVRLDPNGEAETVWARRICPVRARLENIPFPESGFAWRDVVLNDGAPMGTRFDSEGREKSVFNVLELFEPSVYSTYVAEIDVDSSADVEALERLFSDGPDWMEDWTSDVQMLCRACSEGRAHEAHEHGGTEAPWRRERQIGLASNSEARVEELLSLWVGEGRVLQDWGIRLARS
jgi:tetratricopeptide (TPR) repeat protein